MAHFQQFLSILIITLLPILPSSALPLPAGGDLAAKLSQFLSRAQSQVLPPNSTLPAPLSNLTLKYIALGLGTQNYTCASSSSNATPVAIGALANLYDATDAMAAMALAPFGTVHKILSVGTCQADAHNNASQLKQIGQHYFDAAGTPTFDLSPENLLLKSKKMATANAPSDACAGRDGGAAVPWLMLQDDGTNRSQGLQQVFRVETTGGSAPANCAGVAAGSLTRDYAALYYLYGP